MSGAENSSRPQFSSSLVGRVVKLVIAKRLSKFDYDPQQVNKWTKDIVDNCIYDLASQSPWLKYIVNVLIFPKDTVDLHTATLCFWDNETDGSCTVRWANHTMFCIVTVFGLNT